MPEPPTPPPHAEVTAVGGAVGTEMRPMPLGVCPATVAGSAAEVAPRSRSAAGEGSVRIRNREPRSGHRLRLLGPERDGTATMQLASIRLS